MPVDSRRLIILHQIAEPEGQQRGNFGCQAEAYGGLPVIPDAEQDEQPAKRYQGKNGLAEQRTHSAEERNKGKRPQPCGLLLAGLAVFIAFDAYNKPTASASAKVLIS